MKVALGVAVTAVGLQTLDGLIDSLNTWVEFGLKIAALTAATGAAWRWLVGPGYRRASAAVLWVAAQLELIGHLDTRLDTIDERFDAVDERLERGEHRFHRIDQALDALASEEAVAVRRAIREREPVRMRPDDPTAVDRRA